MATRDADVRVNLLDEAVDGGGPTKRTQWEDLALFDKKVLAMIPPSGEGTAGASAIARQLEVDRSKVMRSLGRLRGAGEVSSSNLGLWFR